MYNGHKSYNAWNVSLWINNDETLYNVAKEIIAGTINKDDAAATMLAWLELEPAYCIYNDEVMPYPITPDGVRYTKTNIRLAMRGM